MKIGDVAITDIPAGERVECQNGCTVYAIKRFNGTAYCAECLHAEQQKKWDADGNFYENEHGERVYYEVVREFSVTGPQPAPRKTE